MRNFRLFGGNDEDNHENDNTGLLDENKNGVISVPLFSDYFQKTSEDLYCTNSTHADFLSIIKSSIDIYGTKEKINMIVYEEISSTEAQRELGLISFRKYLKACHKRTRNDMLSELVWVSMFAIIGLAIISTGYSLNTRIVTWLSYVITTFGTVLIWQFVGFWAYQYLPKKRELQRLKQLEKITFTFRKWE